MMRTLLRTVIWIVLVVSLLLEVGMAEWAIGGASHSITIDENGEFHRPSGQTELWYPVVGVILFQGVLVFVLIRLRTAKR